MTIKISGQSKDIDTLSFDSDSIKVKLTEKLTNDNITVQFSVPNSKFIIESLCKKFFEQIEEKPELIIKDFVSEKTKFIFGPPGTGKTTNLANKIIGLTRDKIHGKKILALAPTNKAADVLTLRILKELKKKSESLTNPKWLKRYGYSFADEITMSNDIFVKKGGKIELENELDDNLVIITTVARYPYDSFNLNGNKVEFINYDKWDYIVFDEASMIFLPSILLPYIVNSSNTKVNFMLAGDPFQIPPIVKHELWFNENIYSMVKLDKFKSENDNNVEYLRYHYRSCGPIMKLVSDLNYGGHLILADNKKPHFKLSISNNQNKSDLIDAINVVEYPTPSDSKTDSLYEIFELNGSPYQIYTAILAVEMVQKFSIDFIDNSNKNNISVGIITPYGAQRDIINKLIGTIKFPANITLSCSTAHGFQGDECDVVVAVFNVPNSSTDLSHINNNNIINVAISRAKFNLILFMPDIYIEDRKFIVLKKIYDVISKSDLGYKNFKPDEIERILFNDVNKIKEMTFIAEHQKVNIYSDYKAHYKYEVRKDDNDTVDIFVSNIVDSYIRNEMLPAKIEQPIPEISVSSSSEIKNEIQKSINNIISFVDVKYRDKIIELSLKFNVVPELCYEITNSKGEVIAQAYVAFIRENYKNIAVLLETQFHDEKVFRDNDEWDLIKLDFDGNVIASTH
ncbi:MAG: AAA family ATPase [Bacteroidales bacterium]|nr:AAA family ATPase [Bacteroidales bacterium]